jgi:PAS domain S-box-containing protein
MKMAEDKTKGAPILQQNAKKSKLSKSRFSITNEWYKAIIQSAMEGFFLANLQGEILDVNDAFCRMLGYSHEELLTMRIQDFDVEYIAAPEKFKQRILEVKETGGTSAIKQHKCKDGRIIDVAISVKYLDIKPGFFFCFHRDITEHKKTDRAIKESESKLYSTLSSIDDLVFVFDKEGRFVSFHPDDANNPYRTPIDFIGKKHSEIMPARINKLFVKAFKKNKEGEMADYDYSLDTSGEKRWFHAKLSPILLDKEFNGSVAVVRDITERKQTEEKLRESKTFAENLITSMKDGFSTLDHQGVHLNVNDALCKMTGFTREELVGVGLPHPYWPEEEYEEIQKTFKDTLEGKFADFEVIFKRKNGERFPVIVSPSSLKDKEGNVISYFATIKDITKLKQAEAELQEQMRQRIEFTRALVHELKTPLTSLQIASDSLTEVAKESPYLELAHNIGRSIISLSKKADDLLDIARGEIGLLKLEYHKVNLVKLCKELEDELKPVAASKGIYLECDVQPGLPVAIIDEERISQVIYNLVDNALKFTPKGGEVRILVTVEDSQLVVAVRDTGCGISKERQGLIFKRDSRGRVDSQRFRGLGVGLVLSKMLAELHGGHIWVESEIGKGSTFTFSIPLQVSKRVKR